MVRAPMYKKQADPIFSPVGANILPRFFFNLAPRPPK